ncbi:hypothetical protein [Caballeronia sp. GACF4]|uniref:hypothetical protein n=1 Tax=Caballeronia sp. GACF4 TaxID=2921763 RepID=UPI0020277233|nr:hypothetical protein [Caballeronia sp. GACF4]
MEDDKPRSDEPLQYSRRAVLKHALAGAVISALAFVWTPARGEQAHVVRNDGGVYSRSCSCSSPL